MSDATAVGAVDLGARRQEVAGEKLQGTCARPTCQTLFTRQVGPGRPALFCGEECRRTAQRERRALRTRLAHHERQVQQLRSLVAAYDHGAEDDEMVEPPSNFLAPSDIRRAEDAVAQARVVARFLRDADDAVSTDFVSLLDAVTPVIEHGRRGQLPLR